MKTTQLTTEAAAALAGGHPMTTPLHKQPLAQACKEAKGPIEFHSAVVHTAKEINELAALLGQYQALLQEVKVVPSELDLHCLEAAPKAILTSDLGEACEQDACYKRRSL